MFDPLKSWSVGPFTLSIEMLVLLLAVGVGYAAMNLYLNRMKVKEREEVLDAVMVSIVIGVILYKFWPFIQQPGLLTEPRNLLFYAGGPFAFLVSSFGGIIYFLIQGIRKKWSHHAWDSASVATVSALVVSTLSIKKYGVISPFTMGYQLDDIVYHPVNLYESWLFIFVLLGALILVPAKKKFGRSVFIIIGISVSLYLVSPFGV
ncbi:hypothetical protein [Evansella tamaricis]|uniref:Prolipoprotein diacylglyceryl transferase n=1 Tax=Evansella tamaricis TaxID=2069301 RepID=A0ABS6JF47_9BACI|nr:hypothetical protein [Evansella tamaricis]MBU9712266.1 hypothetical protein [Evansella tamaricis]